MKKICVLMSTYNGEKYLEEQIDSILGQKNVEIMLLVRDDGSKDNTTKILDAYKNKGLLDWYSGKNMKPARSFMDLLKNSPECDYYAFSDQDDFWEPNKLSEAIDKINQVNNNGQLYFSTLNIVDKELRHIDYSTIPQKIDIKNELIKNYATGCTMVFDKRLRNIVNNCNYDFIAMHDSYICRIALLYDCYIYADSNSYIKYRQHDNNVLGMKSGFFNTCKLRFNRFIKSERLSSKTALDLINNIKNIKESDYSYLLLLTEYDKSLKQKLRLLTLKVFNKDEFITNLLFKIKIIFNKV